MKKLLAIAALALIASSANAAIWTISGGGQNFWFTQGVNGSSNQNIYSSAIGPGYACYGLVGTGPTTCAAASTPSAYSAFGPTAYSGSLNDDLSSLNLNWTGSVGHSATIGPNELFNAGVTNGSYDAAGNSGGSFFCFNRPSTGAFSTTDFCGNQSGGRPPNTVAAQTIANTDLTNGFVLFTDNTDGTITIDLSDTTYSSCVNDANCFPSSGSSNIFVQWTLNATTGAVPVPAAVWLFGSALGLLGWLRRRVS